MTEIIENKNNGKQMSNKSDFDATAMKSLLKSQLTSSLPFTAVQTPYWCIAASIWSMARIKQNLMAFVSYFYL